MLAKIRIYHFIGEPQLEEWAAVSIFNGTTIDEAAYTVYTYTVHQDTLLENLTDNAIA